MCRVHSRRYSLRFAALLCSVLLTHEHLAAAEDASVPLADEYAKKVRPLFQRFCGECHSGKVTEADIDFGGFKTVADARKQTGVWVKVRSMLDSEQMPPKDSPQPKDSDRQLMQKWVREFLTREAQATAGDPGPVVLRRLNNDEYNYTVRDLTGVDSLNPTREFPVDGAAGEGFINTGSAQAMSPSFVTKYLDAAKEVAGHAVLLPDGIRFSPHTTRRDQTDELLARIQAFYRNFTEDGGGSAVNLQGIQFNTNQGGLLPLRRYLAATLEERTALEDGTTTIKAVARERSLNAKYLDTLWQTFSAQPATEASMLIDGLRDQWKRAAPADAPKLATEIQRAQKRFWKFNSVGQLTDGGKQKVWMEAVSPIVSKQELRLALSADSGGSDTVIYLAANDLGDGRDHDFVIWQRPRLEFKPNAAGVGHSPIPLRDVYGLVQRVEKTIETEIPRTARYLAAVAELRSTNKSKADVLKNGGFNQRLFKNWAELVGLSKREKRDIAGHLKTKITTANGYADVRGWGTSSTPNLLANRSDKDISFLTLTVPARSVVMHPSPTQESVLAWRSPMDGAIKLSGLVADADDVCGNGAAWRVEVLSETGTTPVASGLFDNGGKSAFEPKEPVRVRKGDVVSVIVNARNNSHSCDTTHIKLNLLEADGKKRKWNLAADVVDRILDGNPLADSYGNADTWHFCATGNNPKPVSDLVPGSALAAWRAAVLEGKPTEELARLAESVQHVLTAKDATALSEPDRKLRTQLTNWHGPLQWMSVPAEAGSAAKSRYGIHPTDFGQHPNGAEIDATSLCGQAPHVLEVRLPAALAAGAEFVTSAELHAETSDAGSVQVQLLRTKPDELTTSASLPILVRPGGTAQRRLEAAMSEFRNLFPAALCYARIVPVDEVVTMTLYFRDDQHLQRLMLDESQRRELDQLWDELFYVAQEPIALTVAFEQIYEFATQDRPDLVKKFGPMRKPINDRADVFRQRLLTTEPAHLDAVLRFADRAWRRPVTRSEQSALRDLYSRLRQSEIPHEESIRLTIARVLTSPAFLYRREQPVTGADAGPVSSPELASRLSFFLWSSMPDAQLRDVADSQRLTSKDAVLSQTRRMLKDARSRRLAIQFACQWLHLRDFHQNDDKNEKLYPEFARLRTDMYEETVRFFEDMFRNDGSILDLLNSDHTFLNESLAKHYGIDGVTGPEWRRVDGIRDRGRGGIFGMATLLASQSGASRTSPILRGNWVYETLLGQRLPRPPANVPQLPESVPAGLTARQLIEQHSSVAACAKCHAKIDPFGFALEQFDAIGRLRPTKVDTRTELEDGTKIEGINGLRDYLLKQRQDDVVRQFCRKLLGFALGREVQLSDEPLLDAMVKELRENEFRFSVAVERIIQSDQFRHIRGRLPKSKLAAGAAPR